MLKYISALLFVVAISFSSIAADKDDECYNYKPYFKVDGKNMSQKQYNKIPKSMQYAMENDGRVDKISKDACGTQAAKPFIEKKNVKKISSQNDKFPASLKYEAEKSAKTSAQAPAPVTASKPAISSPVILNTEPVMIIRFNQPNVYFEAPLQNVISKALDIKPDANFEITSLIQATGDEQIDNANKQAAATNSKRISDVFQRLGLGANRYSINQKGDGAVKSNEFRIFVR